MQEVPPPRHLTRDQRLQHLESQMARLLQDHRLGQTMTGPLPVSDAYMGYRRVGGGRYHLAGTVAAVQDNTRNFAVTADKLYALPFLVTKTVRVNRLATYTQSGETGNGRMGVYHSGQDVIPTRLVKGSGSVAVGSTANYHDFDPPFSLHRGLYWIVAVFSGTPTMHRIPYEQGVAWEILGRTIGISTAFSIGWEATHSFAALPVVYPSAGLAGVRDVPIMWVRLI